MTLTGQTFLKVWFPLCQINGTPGQALFDPHPLFFHLKANSALTPSQERPGEAGGGRSPAKTPLTASPGGQSCARFGREGLARLCAHGAISQEPDS